MSRSPWESNFPDVFVQAPWRSYNRGKIASLKDHPFYEAAKGQRDVGAAIDLIDDLAKERVVLDLFDFVEEQGVRPLLVAPSTLPNESNNALAIGYAQWLSHEYDWPVEERIFHNKKVSRDLSGAWPRIAHRCEFRGEIDRDAAYVLVDDVMTLGGTLADLRSFILSKGGRVIAMSAIASRDGKAQQIRLGNDTRTNLRQLYGNGLTEVNRLLGFDCFNLTEAEGRKVGECYNLNDFRKRLSGARNARNP